MPNSNLMSGQQQAPLINNPTQGFNQPASFQNTNIINNSGYSYTNVGYNRNNQYGIMQNRFPSNLNNYNMPVTQQSNWGGYNNYGQPPITASNPNNLNNTTGQLDSNKGSLESYVARAFEQCQNEKERQILERSLKKIVNNAKARKDFDTIDWEQIPLPNIAFDQSFNSGTNIFNNLNKSYQNDNEPIKVGALLQKRNFESLNQEGNVEIGVNDKGKKVIKTLNKVAHKAKLVELYSF